MKCSLSLSLLPPRPSHSAQVKVFVEGLFYLNKDVSGFKEHLRDFMVQIKVLHVHVPQLHWLRACNAVYHHTPQLFLLLLIILLLLLLILPLLLLFSFPYLFPRSSLGMMSQTCSWRSGNSSCIRRRRRSVDSSSQCRESSTHMTGLMRCRNERHTPLFSFLFTGPLRSNK